MAIQTWNWLQPSPEVGGHFLDALFNGAYADTAEGGFQYSAGSNVVLFRLDPAGKVTGFEVRHDGVAELIVAGYSAPKDAVISAVNEIKSVNFLPFDQLFYSGPTTVYGSPGADDLLGTGLNDTFFLGGGDDKVDAKDGNDTVDGGSGNDNLDGGFGDDDWLNYGDRADAANLILDVFAGQGLIHYFNGRASSQSLQNAQALTANEADAFQNFENVNGSPGDDQITGDAKANDLDGNQGKDILKGLDGNDTLIGDKGRDTMEGGAGADAFVFAKANESIKGAQRDKILGFTHADEIDLSGIDANTDKAGNQKFRFIGTQDFQNIDGELRFAGDILAGDTNGNGIADFEVKVVGSGVVVGDLVL